MPPRLVRAAIDVVSTAMRNSVASAGLDSPVRSSAAAAAVRAELVEFAATRQTTMPAHSRGGGGLGGLGGGVHGASSSPHGSEGAASLAALHSAAESLLEEAGRVDPQARVDGLSNVWLLKPSYGSKGLGMRLFNGSVARMLAESHSQRVVQKYIERPLLLGGYKFDIRCWALVVDWAPLQLWMFDDCLLRFCSGEGMAPVLLGL